MFTFDRYETNFLADFSSFQLVKKGKRSATNNQSAPSGAATTGPSSTMKSTTK
jgi:hypothetical protein